MDDDPRHMATVRRNHVHGRARGAGGNGDGVVGDEAMTIGEMLTALRDVVDARDSLSNQDNELARQEAELKFQLQQKAAEQGVPGFKSDAGSITFNEDLRAKYDPEKWDEIVKWAVDTGNMHIIQRRMTDARVKALMLEGIELPSGLTMESYVKTSFRRN